MSNQRQIIGNGGNRPEVHTRSLTLPPQIGGGGFGQYPGLGGNMFSDFAQGGGFPTPFEGGGFGGAPSSNAGGGFFGGGGGGGGGGGFFGGGNANPSGAGGGGGGNFLSSLFGGGGGGGAAGASSNPLSGLNLNQISGFVQRMGGIDGIIGTMGKFQKFMSTFQQMAPMVKTLLSSIGKGKVNSAEDVEEILAPKRKRRKKSSSSRRRTGSGGIKSGPTKRKRK